MEPVTINIRKDICSFIEDNHIDLEQMIEEFFDQIIKQKEPQKILRKVIKSYQGIKPEVYADFVKKKIS